MMKEKGVFASVYETQQELVTECNVPSFIYTVIQPLSSLSRQGSLTYALALSKEPTSLFLKNFEATPIIILFSSTPMVIRRGITEEGSPLDWGFHNGPPGSFWLYRLGCFKGCLQWSRWIDWDCYCLYDLLWRKCYPHKSCTVFFNNKPWITRICFESKKMPPKETDKNVKMEARKAKLKTK